MPPLSAAAFNQLYCVHLNGAPLSSPQCTQLLALQGSQLALGLLCMRRVLQLAGGSRASRRASASWLFLLHVLLASVAAVITAVLAVVAACTRSSAALMLGSSLGAAVWFFYAVVLCLEQAQGARSCNVIKLFVVCSAFEELAVVLSSFEDASPSASLASALLRPRAVISVVIAALAMLRSLMSSRAGDGSGARAIDPLRGPEEKKQGKSEAMASPLDHVGWFSQLSYSWISPFIALGKKRRLEMHDVPNLPLRDTTSTAATSFERELQHEFHTYGPSKRSFLRVARRLYGSEVLLFGAWSAANKAIGLASPLLLKLFLDWAGSSHPSLSKGYYLAGAMVGRSVLSAVSSTQYDLAWKRFDLRLRAGLVSAIYARTLRLSGQGKRQAGGLGRITNLLSVDVGRIVGMPGTVFDMVLIPAEIAVALILLSQAVSVAFVAGVAVLGIMLPLQTVLGRKIQRVTADMLHFRDERVGLAAESLKAIRTLKLLGWVPARLETMSDRRSLEMGRLQVRKYLDAFCVFFWASTPVIVQTSVFATAVFSGRDISAADAFTAVALLDRLIFPMNYFPWIINGFLEARVSALRIREFLFDREDVESATEADGKGWNSYEAPSTATAGQQEEAENIVSIRDCEFGWNSRSPKGGEEEGIPLESDAETPLLIDATSFSSTVPLATQPFVLRIDQLNLRAGSTYVVCGPVGAGKSSLLQALLGEMPNRPRADAFPGVFRRQQQSLSCSYAPQSPWLFRASVQANITLCSEGDEDSGGNDDPIDHARYEHVLGACELDKDLRDMRPPYDVAESGSNFSGGQRARINLARALYQRAGLYLLDDPLSGLDTNTARKVLGNCFSSDAGVSNIFPSDAAVVLVTHSLHLLPLLPANVQIVVMDGGRIVEQGTFETLKLLGESSRLMVMLESSPSQSEPDSSSDAVAVSETDEGEGTEVSSSSVEDGDSKNKEAATVTKREEEEHREAGVVDWHVWKAYALAVGWALSGAILLAVAVMQVSRNSLDWWIAVYTNGKHAITPHEFATVLLYIAGANIGAVFLRSFLFAFGGLRAARATYTTLVSSVFAAPLRFFERTPVGRILNRLSGDTYAVDESLPFILNIFLKDAADVLGALAILFYGNRLVLLLLMPLSVVYFRLQRDYRPSSRHLKRLDAAAQSPLLAMFTDTLDGLSVIRAARKERQYAHSYGRRLNRSQRVSFLGSTTGAWFGLRLDLLGVCVTSFVVVFAVADFHLTGTVNPGILGLTLTYALPIVGKFNAILNSFVDTERQMIAVERVKEYTDLEAEETVVGRADAKSARTEATMLSGWPPRGHIAIKALTVTYASSARGGESHVSLGDPEWEWVGPLKTAPALKYITCEIPAGQKLGICGRTGAGKTTLLNALFRVVPWERSGSITIDGVPLDSLSLQELRTRLTYIPQDVVLFSGTVRSNLDPTGVLGDEQLWEALRKCGGLANAVAKLERGLDAVVEGGAEEQTATFSQGQAQLLCIARALLRPSNVLCIDEATASIDHETERVISETIATEFATSTVLTVAHRIQTIMHCDRVLLLDRGRVAESGDPKVLVTNPQSLFHRLATASVNASGLL